MENAINVDLGPVRLAADLVLPASAPGLVILVNGVGSGRRHSRNRFVTRTLNEAGMATLFVDLLTLDEKTVDGLTRQLRYDVDLLGRRLLSVTHWTLQQPDLGHLCIGYLGTRTGAAAALIAAAERPDVVMAVVSLGGRPDLAAEALDAVRAPTLFLVGEKDASGIEENRAAYERLESLEKRLDVVTGASQFFEEPGTLEKAAELAHHWFRFHFSAVEERARALAG